MGRCLVLLKFDVPCFVDIHGTPDVSWIEMEEECTLGVGKEWDRQDGLLGEEGGLLTGCWKEMCNSSNDDSS